MIIKYQAINALLQKKLHALYILIGQDHYLLNDAALQIKQSCRQQGECDEKILHIDNAKDWNLLIEEANSYSLFTEHSLLDVRYDKKTLDVASNKILKQYMDNTNPRCKIIVRAPLLTLKQVQGFSNDENVLIIQLISFTNQALQAWISNQLQNHSIRYDPAIPALILQYTQGNMLACAQVIEKIKLIYNSEEILDTKLVTDHLIDQCNYQLYELTDACLAAKSEKAIHLLRQAYQQRQEPILILWLLTQEIRQLIQLSELLKRTVSFQSACSQLKIWPQRAPLYHSTLKRISLTKLYQLLHSCKELDELIKSTQTNQVWNLLEQLAITLSQTHSTEC